MLCIGDFWRSLMALSVHLGCFSTIQSYSAQLAPNLAHVAHKIWEHVHHIILIKSTPLRDHDTPDKILVSSPCLEGCDKHKISSGVAAFWAIPSIFIAKLVVAVSHQGEKLDINGHKSRKIPHMVSVTFGPFVRTSTWPVTRAKFRHVTLRDAWPTNWLKPYSIWRAN